MTFLLRRSRLVPLALAGLLIALVVAVVVAREKKTPQASSPPPRAPTVASTPPPPFAALTTYGSGLTHVAPSPAQGQLPELGGQWRELDEGVGRALIEPTGVRSAYARLSVVAVAPQGAARLVLLTSSAQRMIAGVRPGGFTIIDFPPFRVGREARIGLALSSVQPGSTAQGPPLLVSPMQAEYVPAGEAPLRMPALAELGPGGARGLSVAAGLEGHFAVAPGVRCPCNLDVVGAAVGTASLGVTARVGAVARRARVTSHLERISLGPFAEASETLTLTVDRGATAASTMFLGSIRLEPRSSTAP
jgi:hypothetical protein